MKFSKLFTKIVAGSAMGIMLMSTAAMATTVTYDVPGYSYTVNYGITGVKPLVTPSDQAYAAMLMQAYKVYPGYEAMVVDRFTHMCISADALDKAIAAAKSAADKILAFNLVDVYTWAPGGPAKYLTNTLLSNVKNYNSPNSSWTHVKLTGYDRVLFSDINNLLDIASVGGVDINLKVDRDTDPFITGGTGTTTDPYTFISSDDFVSRIYLQPGHDFIAGSMGNKVILRKSNPVITASDVAANLTGPTATAANAAGMWASFNTPDSVEDVSDALSAYAKLLTLLKTFYSTACNIAPAPTTTTDNDVTEAPTKTTKNAVITAKDKNIKLNSSFNLKAAGVTAADNNGKGKDLTSKITQTGKVDTSKKGTFKVTYYVTGANGKKVSKTVTYTVK